MERNNLIQKGMVIGIICLLILMSVPTVGSEEGKPDFKIVDVKPHYSSRGWPQFFIHIKNCGDYISWNTECRVTIKKLFENTSMCSKTISYGGNRPHISGTILILNTKEIQIEEYLPHIFFGRIFFQVDPKNKVNESNEGNNVVWTFIYLRWNQWIPWTIAAKILIGRRLRQQ